MEAPCEGRKEPRNMKPHVLGKRQIWPPRTGQRKKTEHVIRRLVLLRDNDGVRQVTR
jgi:hypothetical protein